MNMQYLYNTNKRNNENKVTNVTTYIHEHDFLYNKFELRLL